MMSDFQTIKGPFGDTAGLTCKTYSPTMQLRLARPHRQSANNDRLQQKWIWREGEAAGEEWRDVPLVLLDEAPKL